MAKAYSSAVLTYERSGAAEGLQMRPKRSQETMRSHQYLDRIRTRALSHSTLIAIVTLAGLMLVDCSSDSGAPTAPEIQGVDADVVFYEAFRNPETFDDWLLVNQVRGDVVGCLRSRAATFFSMEASQLNTCDGLLTGSPNWNSCHETAESFHNAGVLANDIARTIEGQTRFDATQSYAALILLKATLGAAAYEGFVDVLRDQLPPVSC